ncbi:helix-turn-helix domain-containing protein [Streptomyces sp. NBC_01260]|uniref:helix-turn-helix domain-containing protein n=1 Tax=Streptomyces sp. NBC_01260 TaxID=2903801 RepID=UPI002E31B995|nr:helix-turn-helix domain-containing protein [Streptomyces sp. NBC_01260]
MDTQQIIAPSPAPSAGVVHVNIRHTSGFTVVGNHLSQHEELSLAARGLAVHIQSLPPGARVGIKTLVERLPDSEHRIASALRELEEFGYLKRTRQRGPDGRVHTRTVSYNHPEAAALGKEQQPRRPAGRPAPPAAPAAPQPQPQPQPPAEAIAPRLVPVPTAQKPPPPPLPAPRDPRPQLLHAAAALLAGLRHQAPQLVLTEADIAYLAPAVAAWFERDASPAAVRHALTADLPHPLRFPAKLLRHRLTALLPSGRSLPAAFRAVPLQNCDDCDRAFRAPEPGCCDGCAASQDQAASA